MFDTGEPSTKTELVAALKRLTWEGSRALGTMPLDVFFAPQGDKWSPAEHALHLQKSSAPLALGLRLPAWLLRMRFGRPTRQSRSFTELRDDYRRALAEGGQAGRFAPAREGPAPNPDERRGEILIQWLLTNGRLFNVLARWREDRLDAVQLPHPLLGMLTVREMAAFTVYHTSHHLTLVMQRVAASA